MSFLSPGQYTHGAIRSGLLTHQSNAMQDWNYDVHHCLEFNIFTDCCPYPPTSDLPQMWKDNHLPLMQMLMQVRKERCSIGKVIELLKEENIPNSIK